MLSENSIYKFYVYDHTSENNFPATIYQKDLSYLCRYLNNYIAKWDGRATITAVEVRRSVFHDFEPVLFTQEEYANQSFYESWEDRLLAYARAEEDFYDRS